MKQLIDTNILIYAANLSSPYFEKAKKFLDKELRSGAFFCITTGIIYEFLRVTTHENIFKTPLIYPQAFEFISCIVKDHNAQILLPSENHLETLSDVIKSIIRPKGNIFHDIETVVLMKENSVNTIVTADNDFLQFRFLNVINPLQD